MLHAKMSLMGVCMFFSRLIPNQDSEKKGLATSQKSNREKAAAPERSRESKNSLATHMGDGQTFGILEVQPES
jgi:hypothetical protein